MDEDYLELVRQFPLRPIRTKRDLAAAGAILDKLIGREDLTRGERDYVAALVHFVQDFEMEHMPREMVAPTPLDLLEHLMEANDMTTSDLGEIIGSRGLASEILNRKRGLSKAVIAKLSNRFHVNPGLFLARSGG